MPHGCNFQPSWVTMDEFKTWIKPVDNNTKVAFCKVYSSTINVDSMRIQALRSHAGGEKHKVRKSQSQGMLFNFVKSSTDNSPIKAKTSSVVCSSASSDILSNSDNSSSTRIILHPNLIMHHQNR